MRPSIPSKRNPLFYAVFVTMALGLLTQSAFATNGYFRHGYGVKYSAFGGVSGAFAFSTLTIANNPAGLAFIGHRYDVGLALFSPNRNYTVNGAPSGFPGTFGLTPATVESDSKAFPIPTIGAAWQLNETVSLGVALFANGGMNTNYGTNTFYGSNRTGVDLAQMFLAPTLAIKLGPNVAIGLTPLAAYQRFEAKGLEAFAPMSRDATKLSNNGHDNSFGVGGKIGFMGHLNRFISVGAFYQTKVNMSKFDQYSGLFAQEGDFDIPSNWTIGLALTPTPKFSLGFDVQEIYYTDVKSVSSRMDVRTLSPVLPDGHTPNPLFEPLGSENCAGFGWQDMTIYKFGLKLDPGKTLSILSGFSFGDQPIPNTEVLFNILAPGVIQSHLTFGLVKKLAFGRELSFSVAHAFSHKITGANPLDAPGAENITLKMYQWDFELGYSFR